VLQCGAKGVRSGSGMRTMDPVHGRCRTRV